MKKIIIPRRDHEVYFISMPEDLKAKQVRSFAIEQLNRLHPGFSLSSNIDLQKFIFKGARWIMATIMDAETFAEYKILHKGTAFFTNSSIAVYMKDFLNRGINTIDDERIGFDTEKNEPVSIPLEPETPESETKDNSPELSARVKTIPVRHGVFGKRKQRRRAAAIIAGAALLLLSAVFMFNGRNANEVNPVETFTEPASEIKYLPHATKILTEISSDVVDACGKIAQWQYNEDAEPFLLIRLSGIDALTACQIFAQYDYLRPRDIEEIRYSNGEPYLTLNINSVKEEYVIPTVVSFLRQSSVIPIFNDLTGDLKHGEVSIISEILPLANNSNNFYTITYSVDGRNLIRSLDIITNYCVKYPLKIKRMDISINSECYLFNVVCSLAQCETFQHVHLKEGYETQLIKKEKITSAFGYKDNPMSAKQTIARGTFNKKPSEENSQTSVLGTIRDGSGRMLFYRDTNGGKIKVRGNP